MSGQMPCFMGDKNKKLLGNEIKSRNSSRKKSDFDKGSYQISKGHVFLVHN